MRAVLTHLKEEGYKISNGKVYKDRDAGLLPLQADGTVLPSDVRAYAATLPQVKKIGGELGAPRPKD